VTAALAFAAAACAVLAVGELGSALPGRARSLAAGAGRLADAVVRLGREGRDPRAPERRRLLFAGAVGALVAGGSLAGPLPGFRFCPTGGIDVTTAPEFLALPNVACVGGSWLAPADAVAGRDWGRVEELARQAAALRVA
jgi:hypothetical protein